MEDFICDPFACGGGVCCKNMGLERRVIVFPDDVHRISKNLNITPGAFLKKYCYSDPERIDESKTIDVYYLDYKENKDCIFLEENGLCSIHQFKPKQCVETPFHFLWTGEKMYECMEKIDVHKSFSTEISDKEIFKTLLKGYGN